VYANDAVGSRSRGTLTSIAIAGAVMGGHECSIPSSKLANKELITYKRTVTMPDKLSHSKLLLQNIF